MSSHYDKAIFIASAQDASRAQSPDESEWSSAGSKKGHGEKTCHIAQVYIDLLANQLQGRAEATPDREHFLK